MTAASPNWQALDNPVTKMKVIEDVESQSVHQQDSSAGGALVKSGRKISDFLAPLTPESFREVVTGVEQKLTVVNQTLSMLLDSQGFETILQEMLDAITLKTAELLGADRTTIYLLDEDKNELWSIVAEGDGGNSIELRFPADSGIAGEVATFKKVVNIPYDFYDDPRSAFAKKKEQETGYRTVSHPATGHAGR